MVSILIDIFGRYKMFRKKRTGRDIKIQAKKKRIYNNSITFTWGEIGLVGNFRNESVVSAVLLPPTVDIGRSNLRALSVARSELVYTRQSWWWVIVNGSDVEQFVHTTTNAEKEYNINKGLASNENLQKCLY